mgnify:CR=1 FL=1
MDEVGRAVPFVIENQDDFGRMITQFKHLPDGAAYELGALKLVIAGLTKHVEDHSQGPNGG